MSRPTAIRFAAPSPVAPARGLTFPNEARVPTVRARIAVAAALAELTDDPAAFAAREADLAAKLFAGGEPPLTRDPAPVAALLRRNTRRRARLGHYLPAMWQFDGDWFWALDRLHHLEARLRDHDLLAGDDPLSELHPERAALPDVDEPLAPLEFFYSVRSPYSYLALVAMCEFQASWPTVRIRPVLPMAMRGITIPRAKGLYTLRDVKREADRLGIPFGRAADPLGDGARRLLQVFPLATGTEGQLAFLASAATATWAEGVDVAHDAGLRFVAERAGIAWPDAHRRIQAGAGIDYAEANRLELLAAGLWGVPCYRVGAFAAWGRDRFWMLDELLRRAQPGPPRERTQSAIRPVASAS